MIDMRFDTRDMNLPSMSPSRILRWILEHKTDEALEDYVYIILGRGGRPTGKTWIYNGLKLHGFKAFEITEGVFDLVDYTDDKNHLIIDDINKYAIIVLNYHFDDQNRFGDVK